MLEQYKDGSDITIMNCYYQYGLKNEKTGKRDDDYLVVVYKDNTTGQKKHEIIYQPDYTFFTLKEGIVLDHNLLFIDKEDVTPVTCKFSKLEKTIAELTGNIDYFNDNITNGNRGENRKLHTLYNVFNSDMTIEDHYRFIFGKRFKNDIRKINKSFFDIEVDTRWMEGDFVRLGECPVNAIAFLDERNKIIHSFLLRDRRNPQIADFSTRKAGPT